jgi:tRNA pseudouridine55 synthase
MGHLRRAGTDPFDDRDLVTLHDLTDALAWEAEGKTDAPLSVSDVIEPAEHALEHLPALTIAPSAAAEVATGAPVYAPGIIDVSEGARIAAEDTEASESALVACYMPDGAAVCLGRLVGDPDAKCGEVVTLERVLVSE